MIRTDKPPSIRIAELEAEVARLTKQNDMIFTDAAALTQAIDAMAAQSREQRAEIDRLKAALVEILYCEPVRAASIASRALEGK